MWKKRGDNGAGGSVREKCTCVQQLEKVSVFLFLKRRKRFQKVVQFQTDLAKSNLQKNKEQRSHSADARIRELGTELPNSTAQGDSDVISFVIYVNQFSKPSCR